MKIVTDIPGFDKIVGGGFEDGTVNLVAGESGTCKSIFCIQFLYNRAKKHGDDVCFITTEDPEKSIIRQAKVFGWDIDVQPLKKKFNIIRIEPYNIKNVAVRVSEMKAKGVKRFVIDSISLFELFLKEQFTIRKSILGITENLRDSGMVTLMTAEIPHGSSALSRSEVAEFVADTVIRMEFIEAAEIKRNMTVKKMRFSEHSQTPHPFMITKKGIVVG